MQVSVALAVRPGSVTLARQLVTGAVVKAGGSLARLDDIRLLASEVVTNAIRHAELTAGDFIWLGVDVRPRRVRVVVADKGPGFDPACRDRARKSGGLGLLLVERLSDAWGVARNSVNFVWFELGQSEVAQRGPQHQ